jgi:hypothetical protein
MLATKTTEAAMKRTFKQTQRSNRGYALLITIVFIGIALLLLGSMMDWTNSSAKQTERNNLFNMSTAAAEAATERVIAQMAGDFSYQSLQPATSYTPYYPTAANQTNFNWPVQFSFSDGAGNANQTGVSRSPYIWQRIGAANSVYSNLWAYLVNCTVTSTATTVNQPYDVSATVQQQFQLCSIPIFQFAIFYNMNMEICPGQNMTVNGKTHVNGQIYADPEQTLAFKDTVSSTSSNIIYARNPNDQQTSKTNPIVHYLNPDGSTNISGPQTVDPITIPLGTNLPSPAAILDLPPAGLDPNSPDGQQYLYNQADLIISNSSDGQSFSVYYQNSNNVQQLTPIPAITNNVTNVSYSFLTNVSFYDYRESDMVKAVQLNVNNLNAWLANSSATGGQQYNNLNTSGGTSKGHAINSVYIYNSVPLSGTQLPAVRVANGSVLPSQGLTVVTPQPLYVLGNYNASGSSLNNGTNVVNAAPAALIGDAVTVLSTGWNDSYTSGTGLNSRNAGDTTVNAAAFEGIVESTKVGNTKHYSGGVENFLRLLEDWGGNTLTYNGSIVVMFDSRYATNYWQTPGNYYSVPTRDWGFDVNFSQGQDKLPPISPQLKTLVPTGWKVY